MSVEEQLFNGTESDNFKIKKKHYGVFNKDKTIYFIQEDNGNLGFFAMYRYWLEYLYFADVCGFIPVISAGKKFAYCEKNKIYGTENPFEYYFCQPRDISPKQVRVSRNVVMSDVFHRDMVSLVLTGKINNYQYTKMYIGVMGKMVRKYIKFNEHTWKYIDNGLECLDIKQDKVLGVHVRGTDFKAGYNNHPVYLENYEIFEKISEIYVKNNYNKIFLATDDIRILDAFKNQYGNQLFYYQDVVRNNRNKSVIFENNNRFRNQYKLGLEVIRDMYTLSVCEGLVGGVSQVAVCAQINKISRNEKYDDLIIIDKGIYKNNRYFRRN